MTSDTLHYGTMHAFAHFPANTSMTVLSKKKIKSKLFYLVKIKAGSAFLNSIPAFYQLDKNNSSATNKHKTSAICYWGWVQESSLDFE